MNRKNRPARRRERRTAFSLAELTYLLPIVAAILLITYQVTYRAVRWQAQIVHRSSQDARQADLLRRIRADVEMAGSATVQRMEHAVLLRLVDVDSAPDVQPVTGARTGSTGASSAPAFQEPADETGGGRNGTVVYRIAGNAVTRTAQLGKGPPVAYSWPFRSGDVDFTLENIGGRPRIVWISFITRSKPEQGPELLRRSAAAAAVGRGGMS